MVIAAQVAGDDVVGERQVQRLRPGHALAPSASDGRHPPGAAVTAVLPADRVNVVAAAEKVEIEPDLGLRAGTHVDRCPHRRLIRSGGTSLLFGQIEQAA